MRSVWDLLSAAKRPEDAPEPKGIVYRVRENKALLWISKAIKQVILPILFSAVIVMLLLRAVFQLVDATGFNCQMAQAVSQPGSDPASDFHTKDVCWNSQTDLVEAHKYRITLKLEDPWLDNHHIPAGANGVTRETLLMYLFAPLRRHLFEPYFKVIARIGRYGSSDTPLNLRQTEDGTLTVEITASKSGRLFLYVNDAVIPGPGSWQTFYRNNNGSATVAVEEKGDLNVWQKLR